MAIIRSAKKRNKQNIVRAARGQARRSSMKTQIRKFLDAVHDQDVDRAKEELRRTTKLLDQNAARGIFHRNTVLRNKSRLAARLNALTAAPS